jgi:DNA primase
MLHRTEIDAIKQTHPIADVIARYGIDLRPSGRALVGRCPFHADGGRPNLHVYPVSASFYCFRCAVGGDIFSFIQRIEGVDFLTAVGRVDGPSSARIASTPSVRLPRRASRKHRSSRPSWGADERACLAAAVELYQNRLLGDRTALGYVQGRGVDLATIERCRLGYADGNELVSYLRWRRLPAQAALRVGLLGRHGQEAMAGRVVFPEIRAGQPIWMVGRSVEATVDGPKYLGLPGRKPLLGWESARGSRTVFVVEGPFDWLTLRSWELPALALVGTHVRPAVLTSLARFARIYLVLDNDDAGRAATAAIHTALGNRAVPVSLSDAKDVSDLAVRADGYAAFVRAVHEAESPAAPTPVALAA